MLCFRLLISFCFAANLAAQTLPPGTALPVMVNTGLNAKNTKVGEKIQGKLMQQVMLPGGPTIKSGSHVAGHVVGVSRPHNSGSRITVTFDQLQFEGKAIPLNVSLRALAASENVFQAGVPVGPSATAQSSQDWVTKQVGGDYVFRGRGTVESNAGQVGRWTGTGIWGALGPADNCPVPDGAPREQALWIFSTTACGVYGLKDVKLTHSGDTNPLGQITLESPANIELRGGSGWFLLVNAAPANSPTH